MVACLHGVPVRVMRADHAGLPASPALSLYHKAMGLRHAKQQQAKHCRFRTILVEDVWLHVR